MTYQKQEILCNQDIENWIKKQIEANTINGSSSHTEISNIIKYDSNHNNNIPNWYDDNNNLIASNSKEKAEIFSNYKHGFDQYEHGEFNKNEEYENLLTNFKKK